MTSTGIFSQSADSILQDVDECYFGGALPWYHGTEIVEDGSRVRVTMSDADDESETKEYMLSAAQIKDAYLAAKKKGYYLCCAGHRVRAAQLGLRPGPRRHPPDRLLRRAGLRVIRTAERLPQWNRFH